MFPKYKEIQLPLLSEIRRRGGSTRPRDEVEGQSIYLALATHFGLTADDLESTVIEPATHTVRSKWENMVRWARNDLRKAELLDGSQHGVWALSPQGLIVLQDHEDEAAAHRERVSQPMDPETFAKRQAEAAETGLIGETFVIAQERLRLRAAGRQDLAERIRHVARENVAAGYDILSFASDGSEIYIEVKATKTSGTSFELTDNELRTARRLRAAYWLYQVRLARSSTPQLLTHQDPASMIEAGKLVVKPTTWRVFLGE